jgi:hypothetical protein
MGMTLKQLLVGTRVDRFQQMSNWRRQWRQQRRQQQPQVDNQWVPAIVAAANQWETKGVCIKLCCKGVQQQWQQSGGAVNKRVSHAVHLS